MSGMEMEMEMTPVVDERPRPIKAIADAVKGFATKPWRPLDNAAYRDYVFAAAQDKGPTACPPREVLEPAHRFKRHFDRDLKRLRARFAAARKLREADGLEREMLNMPIDRPQSLIPSSREHAGIDVIGMRTNARGILELSGSETIKDQAAALREQIGPLTSCLSQAATYADCERRAERLLDSLYGDASLLDAQRDSIERGLATLEHWLDRTNPPSTTGVEAKIAKLKSQIAVKVGELWDPFAYEWVGD